MKTPLRNSFLGLIIISFVCVSSAGSAAYKERLRTYHVLHYALDIRIDEARKSVDGTVTITVVPLRPFLGLDVDADAAGMTIRSVRMLKGGTAPATLSHRLKGELLTIGLPREMLPTDTLSLAISYACTPRNGLYFIHPDSLSPDLPVQVWSQGEMEDNHYWFPCYDQPDDKATCEMRVTVNEKFVAISNGALMEVVPHPAQKTKTYFWFSAKPFSSYLISLVVGDYIKFDDHYRLIPLQYWVYPDRKDDALRSFSATPAIMTFYADKIGYDFPWQKYAQTVVSCFTYGGMENVSAATLTDRTLHDARAQLAESSDGLVAHELAHEWFGDLLTCRTWAHAWLNEGFASYFQALWDESSKGRDEFEHEMTEREQSVIDADTGIDRRPTVYADFEDPEDVFDSRIYARGACILHMLRFVLGDEAFWSGIRHYVDLHRYSSVTTDDFEQAMEESARQDLRWFFSEWTVRAGYPVFGVSSTYDSAAGVLRLDVTQTQVVDSLTPLFRMPVAVEIMTRSGPTVQRVMVEAMRDQHIDIPLHDAPLNVVFDKGHWILKRVRMRNPLPSWLYQLLHGDAGEREDAVRELAPYAGEPGVREPLGNVLLRDPFWGVRRRAAEVMGVSAEEGAVRFLRVALADSNALVRTAACAALRNFNPGDAVMPLLHAFEMDSSYTVEAEAVASLIAVDPLQAKTYYARAMTRDSHNEIIRAAAVKAYGATGTDEARRALAGLTADSARVDVRIAAIEGLTENWGRSDTMRAELERLTGDRLHRVRRRAIEELAILAPPASRGVLERIARSDPNGILRREARKALKRIALRAVGSLPSR